MPHARALNENALTYIDTDVGQYNDLLLERARLVSNSSPEPRFQIFVRDETLAMKEKARLGINFNRSLTSSLKSRWDVVEEANANFLQDVLKMNDQIEEDARKYESTLMSLIVSRTTNLSLDSKIEQLGGLFMHINFYNTVMETKIQALQPFKDFLTRVCELMGFRRPSQLLDRHAALIHIFKELYRDYQSHQTMVNKLQDKLMELKSETSHRHMLMHNQMADMHDTIKNLQRQSMNLERFIQEQMEFSSGVSLDIYKVKNAIFNIYLTLMNYRGSECTEMDPIEQLIIIDYRLQSFIEVMKSLQEADQRRMASKKKKKRKTSLDYDEMELVSEIETSSTSGTSFDSNSSHILNLSFNRSTNREERIYKSTSKKESKPRQVVSRPSSRNSCATKNSCSSFVPSTCTSESLRLPSLCAQGRQLHTLQTDSLVLEISKPPDIFSESLPSTGPLHKRLVTKYTRPSQSLMEDRTFRLNVSHSPEPPPLRRYVSFCGDDDTSKRQEKSPDDMCAANNEYLRDRTQNHWPQKLACYKHFDRSQNQASVLHLTSQNKEEKFRDYDWDKDYCCEDTDTGRLGAAAKLKQLVKEVEQKRRAITKLSEEENTSLNKIEMKSRAVIDKKSENEKTSLDRQTLALMPECATPATLIKDLRVVKVGKHTLTTNTQPWIQTPSRQKKIPTPKDKVSVKPPFSQDTKSKALAAVDGPEGNWTELELTNKADTLKATSGSYRAANKAINRRYFKRNYLSILAKVKLKNGQFRSFDLK